MLKMLRRNGREKHKYWSLFWRCWEYGNSWLVWSKFEGISRYLWRLRVDRRNRMWWVFLTQRFYFIVQMFVKWTYFFIDISKNRFTELPLVVCAFIMLERLNCHHNNIRSIPDSSKLKSLTWLNLRYIKLFNLLFFYSQYCELWCQYYFFYELVNKSQYITVINHFWMLYSIPSFLWRVILLNVQYLLYFNAILLGLVNFTALGRQFLTFM